MLLDNIKAKGTLSLVLTDAEGNVKSEQHEKNLVVSSGLAYLASRVISGAATVMSQMAIGSGTSGAVGTDTALGNELGRVALSSSSNVTTNVNNDSVQYIATFGAGVGTGAVTEAGIFNAATNGDMLCRTVFGVINKDAGDTLSVTWKVVFA